MAGGGAWTTPLDWNDGQIVTAAQLDTYLSGNSNALTPAASTITTIGTQTGLSIPTGRGDLVLFANNSSLLTLQGITPANDGQRLSIFSIGSAQIDLVNQSGGASAANRIVTGNGVTLSLAAGFGRIDLAYDATAARWRVLSHDQGDAISFATTWAGGTGTAIGDGTLTFFYSVSGRFVDYDIQLTAGSTTNFGDGTSWTFTLPHTAKAVTSRAEIGDAMGLDVSAATRYVAVAQLATTTTLSVIPHGIATNLFRSTTPFAWASTDVLYVSGRYPLA